MSGYFVIVRVGGQCRDFRLILGLSNPLQQGLLLSTGRSEMCQWFLDVPSFVLCASPIAAASALSDLTFANQSH